LLAVGKYEDAKFWFNEACKHGTPDEQWRRQMGRVEYEVGNYKEAAGHLLGMQKADDISRLYAGFAFYRMGMPGLALYHLIKVENPPALSLSEQNSFYANRAFLNFDQDQYASALADADKALAIQDSPELKVARLRMMLALGRYDDVINGGQILTGSITNASLKADIMDLAGRALYAQGNGEAAVTAFKEAMDLEAGRAELYYLRGMAYRMDGRPEEATEDLQAYQDKVEAVPATYWADRGVTEGMVRRGKSGIESLNKGLVFFPYEVDTLEELGYQEMRRNDTVAARDAFRKAIDVYDVILPVMGEPEAAAYRENRLAMKKQQTTLDKTFGMQAYLSKTDYNLSSNEALLSIDGALPSQYGAEINWRPQGIGFRNERIFEVFGRVLGNFESDSWTPDEQSYQGGVGARYKPFTKLNFNTSFERLFTIGDNAEENWLWRNMMSVERGTRPVQEASWWTSESIYGEISYYLESPERWIYYVDGRLGLSFPMGRNGYFTLPQLMAVGRYQSEDPSGLGTYSMVGVGATARLLQAEQQYAFQGWYLDGFIHYTWGWFEDTPTGFDERSFDGIIFGVNLVK
jgi:tetratricopeptide (TPR) repeat protein